MQARLPITAIVLTKNEEARLDACLKSLRFCEEILVIDSDSTDRTLEIAGRFADKVLSLPWEGFAAQRNLALGHAQYVWVLSVDADERVPEALAEEIAGHFRAGASFDQAAFSVPRKTVHFGRWIRHGGWYPNRLVRLFDKSLGRWEGGELHEYWATRGAVGELRADLEHYSFRDLSDQVVRNDRYSSLGAVKLKREGKPFRSYRLLTKPFSKFLETYVLKRGFLDGYPGFIISVSAAYSVFLKWAKLWELERAEKA
ncbi:glycosyltransferase family 2 protein [bacterium]|nr:glycosyltransferase family 2 protein [bacterium]